MCGRDADGDRLDLAAEYSTDGGGKNWYLIGTKLAVQQGSTQVFKINDVDIYTYDIRITAYDPKGASGFDTDSFVVVPNQPPTIEHISTTPNTIYVSDDVTLTFKVDDPDGDALELNVQTSDDGGTSWNELTRKTVQSGSLQSIVIPDVKVMSYLIKASVVDPPLGERDQSDTSFTVGNLSVKGMVNHTDKWNENRTSFNKSKTGTSQSPRAIDVFWPGERFELRAESTDIATNSSVTCISVEVELLQKWF